MSRPQNIQGLIDAGEARPDLSVPTLAGLSYVLRHRELWPANFEWHYANNCTCAMGLAERLWGIKGQRPGDWPVTADMMRVFGVSQMWAQHVFIFQSGSTPEHIADLIDLYLASKQ